MSEDRRRVVGRLAPLLSVALLAQACERGEVRLLEPEGQVVPTNALKVQAVVAPETGVSAAAFGWAEGVPDADVTLLRVRDFEPIGRLEGRTDLTGSARFDGLAGGLEWVTVARWLDDTEAEALGAEWPVAMLAGAGKAQAGPDAEFEVALRPPHPGGLVISEVALETPPVFSYEGHAYVAVYLELYNNGPTTVFLDGVLLGKIYRTIKDYSRMGNRPCSATEPMRVDPEGLWSDRFLRFPGRGTDHPVAPGQAVVVAVSATDHRGIHPTLHDLTNADFEMRPSDLGLADNPAVPDLEDVGPEPFVHNLVFTNRSQWFLAEPTDIGSLPRLKDPADTKEVPWEFVRIPRERVLDVTHIWWDNAEAFTTLSPFPLCRDPVNPIFDAIPGGFSDGRQSALSAQRRVVSARDGRTMLLDTDISAVDFVLLPTTPGWIPAGGL